MRLTLSTMAGETTRKAAFAKVRFGSFRRNELKVARHFSAGKK